jgi:hypothetical protein
MAESYTDFPWTSPGRKAPFLQLARAVTVLMPELTARGLVLWRLRRSSDQQLWCSVHESSGELKLTVHEPSADRTLVSEVHLTIAPLVERAEHLQERLVSAGWQLVDVDLDEPD